MSSAQGEGSSQEGQKPSRFYVIYVVGGYEEKIALVLGERAKTLKLDVRSVVASKDLKGVVFVEVGNVNDLYHLIRGVRNIKRKRPLQVTIDDVLKLIKPPVAAENIAKGHEVIVIAGPFKGMRGKVIEVRKGEVDLNLLDSQSPLLVTIPIDQVKPAEQEGAA